ICSRCRQPLDIGPTVLRDAGISDEMAAGAKFMRGKGCSYCGKSGYRGRIGIMEMMPVNSKVREMIFQNKSSDELRRLAISLGMKTLYQDGLLKVCQGTTTLEEVYRVAKRSEQDVVKVA